MTRKLQQNVRWGSGYDPRHVHHAPRTIPPSFLDAAEDDNGGHRITPTTVVLTDCYGHHAIEVARCLARANRLCLVNYGWCDKGLALTFRTEAEAAHFVLLWP